MDETRRLLEYLEDQVGEIPEGYGVEIRLFCPDGALETVLRPAKHDYPLLTKRQREILTAARGLTDEATARSLNISEGAVRNAKSRIAMRLGCPANRVFDTATMMGEIPPA